MTPAPPHILVVIPARGGSKGIPRKNLRLLNGQPLLYYAVRTALSLGEKADVVVSSEDEEILLAAGKFGATPLRRDPVLSGDAVTLDGVIHAATLQAEERRGIRYDLVVTMQPTSPLLRPATVTSALARMAAEPELDTLVSVTDDRHLAWEPGPDGRPQPAYTARLNRQYMPKRYRETGGFLIARRGVVTADTRFGAVVGVHELGEAESIDIDTYGDWALCDYHLRRKRVAIVVSGYREIGLGHAYNMLAIAGGILEHEVIFVIDNQSDYAAELIARHHYAIVRQGEERLPETILALSPAVVISDRLDTDEAYMQPLAESGCLLINFEDLGPGATLADLVVNAMYPEERIVPGHYFGHRYFCLRNEFLLTGERVEIRPAVTNVLLTFGGVDPNDFTGRVLGLIAPRCRELGIRITVILGLGYARELAEQPGVEIIRNVSDMSERMLAADLAFTSAGRTTFEVASLGLPTIVLCQNKREVTHFFATAEYGFRNLGLGESVADETIVSTFEELLADPDQRRYMAELMRGPEIKSGKQRVLQLIKQKIDSL